MRVIALTVLILCFSWSASTAQDSTSQVIVLKKSDLQGVGTQAGGVYLVSHSDLEALSEQGKGKALPKNAVILSKKDLEGKVEKLADGSYQINFSDLVLIGDRKEKEAKDGIITPQASVCMGPSVCDCLCGNLLLRVIGIPITCQCSCDPGCGLEILCDYPCRSYFIPCSIVN